MLSELFWTALLIMKNLFIYILVIVVLLSCKNYEDKIYFDYKYRTLLFEGNVNNKKGKFIFDTGASILYLDSTFFVKNFNNLKTVNYKINGVGNSFKKIQVLIDSIVFSKSNFIYSINNVPIIDLKPLGVYNQSGVTGNELFKNRVIGIDYIKKRIDVFKIIDLSKDFEAIPFDYLDGKIIIPLKVEVNKNLTFNGRFILDTGSPNTMNLTREVSVLYNLDTIKSKRMYKSSAYGIGGYSEGFDVKIKGIKTQKFELLNNIIHYSVDEYGALSNGNYDGIIGNKFLENFHIIIDYMNNICYLKPNKNYNKNKSHLSLGFSFNDVKNSKEVSIVNFIYQNSAAENAGLKLGDTIKSINRKKIHLVLEKDLKRIAKNKEVIFMEIKSGVSIRKIVYKVEDFNLNE